MPQPCLHIEEVVIESAVPGDTMGVRTHGQTGQKAKREEGPVTRGRPTDPPALHANDIGRQTKADRSDAREGWRRPTVGNEAVAWIGRDPRNS